MKSKILSEQDALNNLNNPIIRKEVAKRDFFWFFNLYFHHHINYEFANMHKEMISICQNENISLALIMAFRGSGKSTIITTAFPLWAILGIQQRKYTVIVAKTKPQAKQIMKNIKSELEANNELSKDLGPFKEDNNSEEKSEWTSESIVFLKQNARITVVSIEQSLKGLRHRQYRPDLIILDDIEDNESTKTREMREKTYDKYKRDIVPLGDKQTRIIHVGNMLHDNSLIMNVSREIVEGDKSRVFKKYPIINDKGDIFWPSKFPTIEDVEKERLKINDEVAWHLEYLLKIISNAGQIIKNEEIQYYDDLPQRTKNKSGYYNNTYIIVGVDLAISQKESADYTAIVPILYQKDSGSDSYKAYILKGFVHERLDVNQTADRIIYLNKILKIYNPTRIVFVIESVGYQQALSQIVRSKDKSYINIIDKSISLDKEARLRLTKTMFATKSVFFPTYESDDIVTEITGFGREKHDDLVDAVTLSINYAYERIINQSTFLVG